MKIYKSEVTEGINEKAEQLAEKYNADIDIARQAVYAAIIDMLITDDTELVSQAIGNLKWLDSTINRRDRE